MNKIQHAFSRAAGQYDTLTDLHKQIGRDLVRKVAHLRPGTILDVGCGTGHVSGEARSQFSSSRVIGMDFAQGMIATAKRQYAAQGIDWLQGDAEALPFKAQSFDLVMSNLAYQWSRDLLQAFREVRRVLMPGGVFNGSLFSEQTCLELFACIKAVEPDFTIRLLPHSDDVARALAKAGFMNVQIYSQQVKKEFNDMHALLGWLKSIGANQLSTEHVFLGKTMLARADEYYHAHFPYNTGVAATFEVVWIYAVK